MKCIFCTIAAGLMYILATSPYAYSCPKPKMINRSNEPWIAWDFSRKDYCERSCVKEYPDAPCLIMFVKSSHHTYYCGCGIATSERMSE